MPGFQLPNLTLNDQTRSLIAQQPSGNPFLGWPPAVGQQPGGAWDLSHFNLLGRSLSQEPPAPAKFDWSFSNPDAWKFGMDVAGFGLNSWLALQGLGMAKDQFAFQKEMAQNNYVNSVQSYNMALRDKLRGRYSMENKSDAEVDAMAEAQYLPGGSSATKDNKVTGRLAG